MPNKKGSKVAASRARAQANAKKKARSPGPAGVESSYRPPATVDEEEVEESALDSEAAVLDADEENEPQAATRPAPAAAQRASTRVAPRRERVAMAAVQGGSLRHEVGLITAIAVVAGATLALLKILTDIGR